MRAGPWPYRTDVKPKLFHRRYRRIDGWLPPIAPCAHSEFRPQNDATGDHVVKHRFRQRAIDSIRGVAVFSVTSGRPAPPRRRRHRVARSARDRADPPVFRRRANRSVSRTKGRLPCAGGRFASAGTTASMIRSISAVSRSLKRRPRSSIGNLAFSSVAGSSADTTRTSSSCVSRLRVFPYCASRRAAYTPPRYALAHTLGTELFC